MSTRLQPPQVTTVVLALTGTGLAVARDVSDLGPVVGIDADRLRPGLYSRHVDRRSPLRFSELDDTLVAALVQLGQRSPHPVVIVPAADDACEWVMNVRDRLVPHVRVSAGYSQARAGVLLDKSLFGARCRELGIDVPRTMQPESLADVREFAREVGLPCIVKPRAGHLWRNRLSGKKLLVPQTLVELEHAITEIVGDSRAVVMQELVPGPESNLGVGAVWVDDSGQVRHILTARKLRQFPRQFGSGSRVMTEDLPEVRALSAEVVQALGYRGICGTEFKQDPRTGKWRLIEINARPTLWYDLCRAAGTRLIRAQVQELAGLAVDPPQPQRQGVAWEYSLRDLVALGQAGGVRAVLRAAWHDGLPDTDAVLAPDDLGATLAAGVHFAGQAINHLWTGRKKA